MNYGRWVRINFNTNDKRRNFHMHVLKFILENDLKLKRVYSNHYMAIFCGSKNIKRIIEEINLLNYYDDTFIW